MMQAQQGMSESAEIIANVTEGQLASPEAMSALDSAFTGEMIQMQVYKLAFEANAQVAAQINDMLGQLVDSMA